MSFDVVTRVQTRYLEISNASNIGFEAWLARSRFCDAGLNSAECMSLGYDITDMTCLVWPIQPFVAFTRPNLLIV